MADELSESLAMATKQKLTEAEAWAPAEVLCIHEPWAESVRSSLTFGWEL